MSRAEQREQTRERIVDAAVAAFAEHGFAASSTRDIAARAGVTQGLVTYHFPSKDELWRVAADKIFGLLEGQMPTPPESAGAESPAEGARAAISSYVQFAAQHPEMFDFMVDAGRNADDRMRWLVDTHLAGHFARGRGLRPQLVPGLGIRPRPARLLRAARRGLFDLHRRARVRRARGYRRARE